MTCDDVQFELSRREGRRLRPRRLRSHVRACDECSLFGELIDERAGCFALLAPPMPGAAAAALLEAVLDAPQGP